jgi:hypothetical protein
MSAYAGPEISSLGMILAVDAKNINSLTLPSQGDHGYADWYCFVSGTATYSILSSGVTIYQRTSGGVVSVVVSTSTGPTRGTFSVTADNTYYSMGGPINLVVEDAHHSIAPLTMVGKQFWYTAARNNPTTLYVYSPFGNATVNFYDGVATGLAGTPTSTSTINQGSSGTFSSNNLQNMWISSNIPIIATATQTGADKTILSPMARYVYQRYQSSYNTTNNTAPTNLGTYVTYDSAYNVMNMNIADGSGGDCAQGLGYEYLSDSYSWGNVLSDYTIVAPIDCYIVTSYWNGSNWVVWDTHTLTGTQTNPAQVMRDGTNGPGVTATIITGAATNMASGATLWKWEGTNPFYICINDSADDEFSVLGWMSYRTAASTNTWRDLSGIGNNLTLSNGPIFDRYTDSLIFDGSSTLASVTSSSFDRDNGQEITVSCWIRPSRTSGQYSVFCTNRSNDNSTYNWIFYQHTDGGEISFHGAAQNKSSYVPVVNVWINVVNTVTAAGVSTLYVNGISTFTVTGYTYGGKPSRLGIGANPSRAEPYSGNIANVTIYNRALSAAEIRQNFNALRGRFGI